MRAKLSEQIMLRVDARTLAALKADAKAHERTVAQTVRWAVRCYLAPQRYEGVTFTAVSQEEDTQ